MSRLAEFFEEENGKLSSMRLNSFLALLGALGLSFRENASFEFVLMFLVAAFAPKAFAKFSESRKQQK